MFNIIVRNSVFPLTLTHPHSSPLTCIQVGVQAGLKDTRSAYTSSIPKPTGPGIGGDDFKPEDLKHMFEGMTIQQYHESLACPMRLIECPMKCLEYVRYQDLQTHMTDMCTKREAKKICCRLGCGMLFGGLVEQVTELVLS